MSCPCGAFLRRWNSRLLLMYSSAIIICSPPVRAEADDILCRVDHLPVTVDPGENWSIRHSSAVGINTVTGHGLRSIRTGKECRYLTHATQYDPPGLLCSSRIVLSSHYRGRDICIVVSELL